MPCLEHLDCRARVWNGTRQEHGDGHGNGRRGARNAHGIPPCISAVGEVSEVSAWTDFGRASDKSAPTDAGAREAAKMTRGRRGRALIGSGRRNGRGPGKAGAGGSAVQPASASLPGRRALRQVALPSLPPSLCHVSPSLSCTTPTPEQHHLHHKLQHRRLPHSLHRRSRPSDRPGSPG